LAQDVAGDGAVERAVAQATRQATVEQLRLQRGERQPAQEPIARRRLPAQDRRAQGGVVASLAEPLRTVQVGCAARAELRADALRPLERLGNRSAHRDAESIAAQASGTEPVAVTRG